MLVELDLDFELVVLFCWFCLFVYICFSVGWFVYCVALRAFVLIVLVGFAFIGLVLTCWLGLLIMFVV